MKNIFKNILKDKKIGSVINDKQFINIIIVLLVIVFFWLATTSLLGGDLKKSNKSTAPRGATEVTSDETITKQINNYEEQQKEELKAMLGKMKGVGNVEVMMYFESGEVKVPAVNETTQVSETQENDREGGTRKTNQQNGGSTVVMSSDSGANEPFIVKTYKPQITGVYIVAEGAENSKIRYDIQVAVSTLYNLSLDKVNVYPMEK